MLIGEAIASATTTYYGESQANFYACFTNLIWREREVGGTPCDRIFKVRQFDEVIF